MNISKELKEFRQILDDTFRTIIDSESDTYIKHKMNGWLVDLWARGGEQEYRRQYANADLARISLDVGDVDITFELADRQLKIRYEGPHSGEFPPIDMSDPHSSPHLASNVTNLVRLILDPIEFPDIKDPGQAPGSANL